MFVLFNKQPSKVAFAVPRLSIVLVILYFSHGTVLRRAMDDGCLDMSKAFHVGCRGSVTSKDVLIEDKEQGWTTIDLDTFVDIGPVEAARRVKQQIGKYLLSYNVSL